MIETSLKCVVLIAMAVMMASASVGLCGGEKIPAHSELYIVSPEGGSTEMIAAEDDRIAEIIGGDPNRALNLVVVTHGWFERYPWNQQMAQALRSETDPNMWICASFEWRGDARHINPVDAAKAALKTTGPLLGEKILALPAKFAHIHLIGHSAGSWVISEAAKIIAEKTDATLHLTFLDAYVPPFWDEADLATVAADPNTTCWAEHYMTRDFTLGATQKVLTHAHNVDLTKIDPGFNDHRLPHYWYHATIIGKYDENQKYGGKTLHFRYEDLDYGFARSLEAGADNYKHSTTLPLGNKSVQITKPKTPSWFENITTIFNN